jgi:fructuronate reductase
MDDAPRLSNRTLAALPGPIGRPRYDRAGLSPGIVHLGIGAFHRAHQAASTDAVLEQDASWGIVAASLRSPETRDALTPQDGLYTLVVRSSAGEQLSVVGAVTQILVAPESPEALLAAMTDPRVRIVSLTVTEKGYCHDPASGALNEDHPDIVHDLRTPAAPRSAPGFVVESLRHRRAAGIAPFTVLTCDNLPSNGRMVHKVLTRFAELRDPALGRYLEAELACPSSMVDRITPATTAEDRAAVARALGVRDAWPVITEPFTQWVIEDRFPGGRPPWESAGAELVADVEPYELMKLRLLNGPHSTLAYLGYLAGFETVSEVMGDKDFAAFVRDLMEEEIAPTLAVPAGVDVASYTAALRERFRNPALKHRTWQIAMDGSQKLPQRLLGTIRDRLRSGRPVDRLALGVAGWMRYVSGTDERNHPIDVRDPLADRIRPIAAAAGPSAERLAPALLALEGVFGTDLPAHPPFVASVTAALDRLFKSGAARAVAEANGRGRA